MSTPTFKELLEKALQARQSSMKLTQEQLDAIAQRLRQEEVMFNALRGSMGTRKG